MKLIMLLKKPVLVLKLVDIVLNRNILGKLQITALNSLYWVDRASEEFRDVELFSHFAADVILGVLCVFFKQVLQIKLLILIISYTL